LRAGIASQKKRGYRVCASGYAATDTSYKKDAANSSAQTVTQKEAEPQKNSPCVRGVTFVFGEAMLLLLCA
jgi:hypothetical protein